jgi:hypothetical protein
MPPPLVAATPAPQPQPQPLPMTIGPFKPADPAVAYANDMHFTEGARRSALGGLRAEDLNAIAPVELPAGVTLLRFGHDEPWFDTIPGKPRHNQVQRSTGRTIKVTNAMMQAFLKTPGARSMRNQLLSGAWWVESAVFEQWFDVRWTEDQLNNKAYTLADVYRQRLAIAYCFGNMRFLMRARLKPGVRVKAWIARGRDVVETERRGNPDWVPSMGDRKKWLYEPIDHKGNRVEGKKNAQGQYIDAKGKVMATPDGAATWHAPDDVYQLFVPGLQAEDRKPNFFEQAARNTEAWFDIKGPDWVAT